MEAIGTQTPAEAGKAPRRESQQSFYLRSTECLLEKLCACLKVISGKHGHVLSGRCPCLLRARGP